MCKYNYQNKESNTFGKPCIFSNFYTLHDKKFGEDLLLDEEGYCIFHSKNAKWKLDNDFKGKLFELIKVIAEVNLSEALHKWNYYFSGFNFPNYESIEFEDIHFKNAVDLSNCMFDCRIDFKKMTLNSLDIRHSIFNKKLSFNNVDLSNSLIANNASFHNGLSFTNCNLEDFENYIFFEKCTFYNEEKSASNNISIRECNHVYYMSFNNSLIKSGVYIKKSGFDNELTFDNCILEDSFSFDRCQINGTISFQNSEFSLNENLNPMESGTHFSFVELNEKGIIIFKGKSVADEMMKNELSIHFKDKPKGLITFENFNLNKIHPKFRITIPELEKEGIVEIGKGCRKYYCTTEIITIEASNSNQKIILDIITVFCNYFELQQGHNLGIEIIERSSSKIRYFYFTDEIISQEVFNERIKQNESSLWNTFANLTTKAHEVVSAYDREIRSCLIDITAIFLKIGNQLTYNNLLEQDYNNIFKALTVNGETILDTKGLGMEFFKRANNLNKIAPTIIIKNMGNNYVNYGNVDQFGENNYKTSITNNANISDEQKQIIFKTIDEITKEAEPIKKESKLKKFIKDYGPTIGETAVKIISSL